MTVVVTPEERSTLEARAERAVRRGELTEAFRLFQELVVEFPSDGALSGRVAQLREALQPAELLNPKSNFKSEPSGITARSPVEEAEALASKGDYAGAIAAYRTILDERPDAELVKERLAELFALVQAQAPRRPSSESVRVTLLGDLLDRISTRKKPDNPDREG